MKQTALVIMAAGIGSRFGKGIKQLAKVGPSGEIIMDYSIHDALDAGFNKVVFIIRKDIEEEFDSGLSETELRKLLQVEYVYQDIGGLTGRIYLPKRTYKTLGNGTCCFSSSKGN